MADPRVKGSSTMQGRVLLAWAVLLSLLALGATAAPSHAEEPSAVPAFGVQMHATWSDYTDEERIAVLDLLAEAGVEWIRVDFGWSSAHRECATCGSGWHLDLLESIVDAAQERDIEVLLVVWRTPDWANDGAGPTAPPTDPDDYGRFLASLVERFGDRIGAYQVWNEPNEQNFFDGTVEEYVGLLRSAYEHVRAVDADVPVVLGGPAYSNTTWLRAVYEAGAAPYFDIAATHPYMAPQDLAPETEDPDGDDIWLMTHTTQVLELMDEYGDHDKELWFTEFGWTTMETPEDPSNSNRGVSEETQGDYLVRSIDLVEERWPRVTNMFWYNARERDSGSDRLDGFGLIRRDLTPKPAYHAMSERLTARDTGTDGGDDLDGDTGDDLDGDAGDDLDGDTGDDLDGDAGDDLDGDAGDDLDGDTGDDLDGDAPAKPKPDKEDKNDRTGPPFRDVGSSSPHFQAVSDLSAQGIIQGTGPDTYSPGRHVTRAQIASLLDRTLEHLDVDRPAGHQPFADVGGVHAGAIERLAAAGVVAGVSADRFDPQAEVTRGQLARLLLRSQDLIEQGKVRSTGLPLDEVVGDVVQRGLANGYPDGDFRAGDPVRRDQAASFVFNLLESTASR